jgi:hypothetical protein
LLIVDGCPYLVQWCDPMLFKSITCLSLCEAVQTKYRPEGESD